jgi:hypothetical protein
VKAFPAAIVVAAVILIAGCGGSAQPYATRSSPSSCAASVRAADPSLTAPQVRGACATPSSPPPPSPAATSARLAGNCVMGYENNTPDQWGGVTNQYSGFTAGAPQGATIGGNHYAPALAYQLTLTDGSSSTAEVDGFAVVFYDSSGTEAGSDQQQAQPSFIVPGQSLTWTELANTATDGSGDGGSDGNIPANAAACDLVQWYGPPAPGSDQFLLADRLPAEPEAPSCCLPRPSVAPGCPRPGAAA